MAYLDEIATLLRGSSDPLYVQATGDYITGVSTSVTGLVFALATSDSDVLAGVTTSTGFLAESTGDYITGVIEQSTVLPSDWSLFLGHMPDSTVVNDKAVALIETPGGGESGRLDMDRRGLQVLVRGSPMTSESSAYEVTEVEALVVREALVGYAGSTGTQGTHYVGIWGESGPFFAGFDASYRPQFSANYRVWRSR